MPYPHAASVVGDPVPTAIIEGPEQASCQVITFDPPGAGCSKRPGKLDLAEMLEGAEEALHHCAVNLSLRLCYAWPFGTWKASPRACCNTFRKLPLANRML